MTKQVTTPSRAESLRDEQDESSQIRRLSSYFQHPAPQHAVTSERGSEPRDTFPCAPPPEVSPAPFNLERTLRFARLLRETLPATGDITRLLDLAILRRDAILLQALMRHLYQVQQRELESALGDPDAEITVTRSTLLPPPPSHTPAPLGLDKRR